MVTDWVHQPFITMVLKLGKRNSNFSTNAGIIFHESNVWNFIKETTKMDQTEGHDLIQVALWKWLIMIYCDIPLSMSRF